MNIARLLIRFGIFSLIIAGLILALQFMLPTRYIHEQIWAIFGFFFAMGIVFYGVNYYSSKLGDEAYAMGSLAALVIKFLASGIFVVILLLNGLSNRLWFIANFFLIYLLFTVFEIKSIISNLRAQKKL